MTLVDLIVTTSGVETPALSGMGSKRRLRSSSFHPLREAAFL
jgi:hypothetical protein